MTFTENLAKELARMHANHQLRKVTSIIAEEIESINERLDSLEKKK